MIRRACPAIAVLCMLVSGCGSEPAAPEKTIWPGLDPGPHAVGFRVERLLDHSRTFSREPDPHDPSVENARPIQVWIWYPASPDSVSKRVRRSDYLLEKRAGHSSVTPSETDRKQEIQRAVQALLAAWKVDPGSRPDLVSSAEAMYTETTIALRDAEWSAGRFPLILHMAGWGGSPSGYTVLFEYLASHGYVIAALPTTPSYRWEVGVTSPDVLDRALEPLARDFEFTLAFMNDFPNVDASRVGVSGMSWGGFANVLVAQRNFDVDAVLTLDGGIHSGVWRNTLALYPTFDSRSFAVPYMALMPDPKTADYRYYDIGFYEELLRPDAYLVQFSRTVHRDFVVERARPAILLMEDAEVVAHKTAFVTTVCRLARDFFDAYLESDAEALHTLEQGAVGTGTPEGLIARWDSKRGRGFAPTGYEFLALLKSEGAEHCEQIFQEERQVDPDYIPFATGEIGALFEDLMEEGRARDAAELAEFWSVVYPNDVGPLYSAARAYEQLGDVDMIERTRERILELEPHDSTRRRGASVPAAAVSDEGRTRVDDAELPSEAELWDLMRAGRMAEARRLVSDAMKRNPAVRLFRDEVPLGETAMVWFRNGDVESAIELLLVYKEAFPEATAPFVRLGRIYEATGDRERAIEQYQEANRRHPGIPPVLEALERLGVTPR